MTGGEVHRLEGNKYKCGWWLVGYCYSPGKRGRWLILGWWQWEEGEINGLEWEGREKINLIDELDMRAEGNVPKRTPISLMQRVTGGWLLNWNLGDKEEQKCQDLGGESAGRVKSEFHSLDMGMCFLCAVKRRKEVPLGGGGRVWRRQERRLGARAYRDHHSLRSQDRVQNYSKCNGSHRGILERTETCMDMCKHCFSCCVGSWL